MKSKKSKYGLLILCLLLIGIAAGFRYRQVNAHPALRGVTEEKFFKRGELVHAYHVDFVVHQVKLTETKDEARLKVRLSLKQTGTANYGLKKDNPDFRDNMFFNVPYGISNQCDYVLNKKSQRVGYNYIAKNIKKKQLYTLYFSVPRETYDKRTEKTRFSFLVPLPDHYIKYSLLLE
ncbi:hypothetical protein PT285_03105 [Lactobacillus sp. ESL0791]|uniref:hypothetical protein n=1 Tax=Lactobacillus sp. ESL0791 TaxID=2983234 RepID=UPI0023F889C2|nr:hypothetical protein [Lactobacillus sp. ESL0791]MDF7638423.1 hypothetical protein [Lactobacillus sp. ESL0791]